MNADDTRHHDVARYLARRAGWRAYEYIFWAVAFASLLLFIYAPLLPGNAAFNLLKAIPDKSLLCTEIAILALFALSLDLILGYAGILSLGHAAYFGFGGYLVGIAAVRGLSIDPVLALVLAGLCSALFGLVTSFLVLRGSDLTRLMVTLGVALVLRELANQFSWLTGGADGLQGVTVNPIFGRFEFDLYGHTAYTYSLIVLFVLFLVARRMVYSPFGLALRSVKGNPLRAAAVGIPVNLRLVAVYTVGAAFAGISGALLTQTTAFVSLDVFSIERSADLLLVLIIGGVGYLYGGLIGAVIYKFLQQGLSDYSPQYWQFWIGLLLVMMMLFGRVYGGILAALIFGVTVWFDLSTATGFAFTAVAVLVLGIFRTPIVAAIARAEAAALRALRRMLPQRGPIAGRADNVAGA